MGEHNLLCIVLFTMIIGSQTVPHTTNKRNSKDPMQKDAGSGNMGHDIGEIMFPDEMPQTKPLMRKDFSAEGKGIDCVQDVCEKAADYPSEYIEAIVKKLHGSADLEGAYVGNYIDTRIRTKPEDPEQQLLCPTQVYTKYPQAIKNDRNISKYIINDDKYKQGVIYETCLTGARCDETASFPTGIQTACIQKYSKVRLLAVEVGSTGTAEGAYDTFIVPSCCVCSFKKLKV